MDIGSSMLQKPVSFPSRRTKLLLLRRREWRLSERKGHLCTLVGADCGATAVNAGHEHDGLLFSGSFPRHVGYPPRPYKFSSLI